MPERDRSMTGWITPATPETPSGPQGAAPASADQLASPGWLEQSLPLCLDAYEKAALERALVETWGDASEAARRLGIGRSTFYRKAGKHGINLADLRSPSADPHSAPPESGSDAIGVGATETLG